MDQSAKQGIFRSSKFRRIVCSLVIAGFIPLSLASCYGSFPLTHALYKANGDVSSNKFVRSIVTWVLIIIPVYGICMFVDFIALNLVEFWSGNEIHVSQAYQAEDGSTVALQSSEDGKTLNVTVSRDGKVQDERHFVHVADGRTAIYGADPAVQIGMVTKRTEGGFLIEDYTTGESHVLSSGDIEEIRAAVMAKNEGATIQRASFATN